MSTIISFVCVLVLIAGNVYDATAHKNDEISITFPDDWTFQTPPIYEDPHPAHRYVTMFVSEHRDASVLVSAYQNHEYPLAQIYKAESAFITAINKTSLGVLAKDAESRCRSNIGMQCWNYDLKSVEIVVTSNGKRSGMVTYTATINDRDTYVRMVAIADDHSLWIAEGLSYSNDAISDVNNILASFYPKTLDADIIQHNSNDTHTSTITQKTTPTVKVGIALEQDIHINVIIIGKDAWTLQEIKDITDGLPTYYDPIYSITGETVGPRYNYNYEFVSKPEHVQGLVDTMTAHSDESDLYGTDVLNTPIWQELWAHEHGLGDIPYRQVDAKAVESYIQDNIIRTDSDLAKDAFANLVFIDIPHNQSGYLQNYYTSNADAASLKRIDHVGLMGYGGSRDSDVGNADRNRLFFYDIWAVPWIDYNHKERQYVLESHMRNMYMCLHSDESNTDNHTYGSGDSDSDSCRTDIVESHVSSATHHIITPSLLYPIQNHKHYKLDILLYLKPGSSVTVTPATIDNFLNEDTILDEMRYLYPNSEWEIEVSIERRDLRGLSYDFKRQFEQSRHVHTQDILGNDRQYALLSTKNITPYLTEWGQARHTAHSAKEIWSIPILVVIDSTDTIVLFDNGLLGMAAGMPEDATIPCCAIGVADERDVWNKNIGLTNLILHETGHLLGLGHSFVGYDKARQFVTNTYYDWYSSPMTYSLPVHPEACGFLFSVVYEQPCGNGDMSFTEFERDVITGARIASLLKGTLENINGGDPARVVPVSLLAYESATKFKAHILYGKDGALATAVRAYDASKSINTPRVDVIISDSGAISDMDSKNDDNTNNYQDDSQLPSGSDPLGDSTTDATTATKTRDKTDPSEYDDNNTFDGTQRDTQEISNELQKSPSGTIDIVTKMVFVGDPYYTSFSDNNDKFGEETALGGQNITIAGRVSNTLAQAQNTTLFIKITDSDGFVAHIDSARHLLAEAQTITYAFEWTTPEDAGVYTVDVFSFDADMGVVPLGRPTHTTINVIMK